MILFDTALGYLSLFLVSIAILIGPWFFGAWETWWFWPFTGCIFAASLLLGLRMIVSGRTALPGAIARPGLVRLGIGSLVPFLIYAFIRMWQADVFMDAERSFLLFLTPVLLSAVIVCGATTGQARLLGILVIVDLVCLGLYGVLNDTGKVLWADGYEQYAGRATGTYFCPDHFSGIMELLFALALGLLLGRKISGGADAAGKRIGVQHIAAIPLVILSLCGVWLSQSRGGGMTIIIVAVLAFVLGLQYLVRRRRWAWQLGAIAVTVIMVAVLWQSNSSFMTRFRSYFAWDQARDKSLSEKREIVLNAVSNTPRYNMYSAALRAWQTQKLFGIGPGMHQHLWPHFAASPDGNRSEMKRPTRLNAHYISYEVHSDWIQLLEEYGIVGLLLFGISVVCIAAILMIGLRQTVAHPAVLGGVLSLATMAFHSLGDFNLQMPATTWILSAILSVAIVMIVRPQDHGSAVGPAGDSAAT